jgi:hypothetical protein
MTNVQCPQVWGDGLLELEDTEELRARINPLRLDTCRPGGRLIANLLVSTNTLGCSRLFDCSSVVVRTPKLACESTNRILPHRPNFDFC